MLMLELFLPAGRVLCSDCAARCRAFCVALHTATMKAPVKLPSIPPSPRRKASPSLLSLHSSHRRRPLFAYFARGTLSRHLQTVHGSSYLTAFRQSACPRPGGMPITGKLHQIAITKMHTGATMDGVLISTTWRQATTKVHSK